MFAFLKLVSRFCPPVRQLLALYLLRTYSTRLDAAAARFFSMEDQANG